MKKEVFFAILAGGLLGLIIAFGIWRLNSSFIPNPPGNQTESSPRPSPGNSFSITLTKIENNDVITLNPLDVDGLTKPFSLVAISGESNDYVIAANSDGEFDKNISLDAGINQILIDSFDQNGDYSEITPTLVYSPEFAKNQTATSTPAASSDDIRNKVQQKVDEALNKPKADIGLITDIMESTIQVKTNQGDIQQVSTDTDTTYSKNLNNKISDIKFTDLAIGDYIVAMGTQNDNKVLGAERILVTDPPPSIKRNILMGKITDSTTKTISFKTLKDSSVYQVTYNKNTDFLVSMGDKMSAIKLTKITDDDTVFLFNIVNSDNSFTARTVIVVREATASPSPSPSPSPTPTASPKP